VWDEEGNEYVDLYAGFAVANVGWCHPRVTEAIQRQAAVMTHCPSAHPSRVRLELYERLASLAPPGLERILISITGSMANELALALARAATGRHEIVAFSGGYFGRGAPALALAGKRSYRSQVPVRAGAQFLPYPDPYRSPWAGGRDPGEAALALVRNLLEDPASGADPVAAIFLEPVQGNGGVVIPSDDFLRGLRELCDRHGCLLVFDEVQCGFGRTGRTWAFEHADVVPDLMTVGKGIGGGLTVSAVLGREDVMTTWGPDATTSTFLTNALNEAAACAAIDVFVEERLAERSARLGETALARLRDGLAQSPVVGDVRGRGLFIGIELREPDAKAATGYRDELRRRGFLVGGSGRYGNVLKLSPPLVIEEEDLDNGLEAIVEVLG
jgi:4-aminobutyrate aminotransferase-like enzyme